MCDERLYQEEEIDLFEYVKIIYRYRKIVIGIVLVSVFLNAIYIINQPFRYKATATFFPLNVKQYKSANEEQPELKSKLVLEDLIISILKSRGMADKITNDLQLKTVWNKALLEDIRDELRSITGVSLGKGGVITLDVITQNPELSSKIANAYVDNLESFNKELQLSTDISLVQTIDRAVPPERRIARGLIKKSILVGIVNSFIGVFLVFVFEYIKKSGFKKKIMVLKDES